MKLNEQQMKVVNHKEGNCVIFAGAGSGKSTCLVSRTKELVDSGVPQSEILLITFTNASAMDLKRKLKNKGLEGVACGTYHAVCARLLSISGIDISKKLQVWEVENLFSRMNGNKKVDLDDIMSFISYQKNHRITCLDEFIEKDSSYSEEELRSFFRAYEDLKKSKGVYDFDDYLLECLKLYENGLCDKTWEYLQVDENQDNNSVQSELMKHFCPKNNITLVGDEKQCLTPDTKIRTVNGIKEIKDITYDDEVVVACGRGKVYKSKIDDIMTKEYDGDLINIRTKSGKEIRCTPNHGIFASRYINSNYYIYLMYREGYGFRIGMSSQNRTYEGVRRNGFQTRLVNEKADKVWCIKICHTLKEAKYYENYYAFKYGIPLYVFDPSNHSELLLDEYDIKRLFKETDSYERGLKLLEDLGLNFSIQHGVLKACTEKISARMTLTMFGSSREKKGRKNCYVGNAHEITCSTTNDCFANSINNNGISINPVRKKNGYGTEYWEIRKTSGDYDLLWSIGDKCSELMDNFSFDVKAVLSKEKTKIDLFPASYIKEGMILAISNGTEIIDDEVVEVKVEHYKGVVYDLNIPMYRNYIANDIVVHNCLYSFRAARPELFLDAPKRLNAKVIHLNTNYRSAKSIVDISNSFAGKYFGNYEFYKPAIANSVDMGRIETLDVMSKDEEAYKIVNRVSMELMYGVEPNEIAILYRNHSMAAAIELELREQGIEYEIEGNGSFFKQKQIEIILSVLRLAIDPNDNNAYELLFKSRVSGFKFLRNTILEDIRKMSNDYNISFLEAAKHIHVEKSWQRMNLNEIPDLVSVVVTQCQAGLRLNKVVENIIRILKIRDYIEENAKNQEELESRLESLDTLLGFVTGESIQNFLHYAYDTSLKRKREKKSNPNAIRLQTIHKSKGLEYDVVFLVGLTEKFPSKKSSLIDECSCMYVGMTRAKNKLYISGNVGSQFFEDIQDGLMEI